MLPRHPMRVEIILALCLVAAPFVLPPLGFAPGTINQILVWGLFGIGFDILFGYTGLLSCFSMSPQSDWTRSQDAGFGCISKN